MQQANKSIPFTITTEDILMVSTLMGMDFTDPELVKVIQTLESCDIHACPGSGKTTTLVAKLLILASKLNGTLTGICALSHTNAARIEIEKMAGKYACSLLRFPHFIGTFQVFVNTYLAVPGYIDEFGYPPAFIDNDSFRREAFKNRFSLPRKTIQFLEHRPGGDGGEWKFNLAYKSNDRNVLVDSRDYLTYPSFGNSTETYKTVLQWKNDLTSKGYLTFHDAYAFAFSYLNKYPSIIPFFARRFRLVFIDEMQDTIKPQNDLIELLFKNRSILQQIGDPNQAIYDSRDENGEPVWQPKTGYTITKSRRLSPSIAKLSQSLCVNNIHMTGNSGHLDCNHTIILFNLANVEKVITRFAQIIEAHSLCPGKYKAVGAVGKPKDEPQKLTITSYFPTFKSHSAISSRDCSFWSLIDSARISILKTNRFAEAYTHIIDALVELFRIQNPTISDKRTDRTSSLKFIRSTGLSNFLNFKRAILHFCEYLINDEGIDNRSVLAHIKTIFSFFDIKLSPQVESLILDNSAVTSSKNPIEKSFPNIFTYNQDIQIEVDTIQSVKGQTHRATLVFETYFKNHDLMKIKSYLSGQTDRNPGNIIKRRYLPLTYVACTRPTHLLCLAIDESHLDASDLDRLSTQGWHIDRTLSQLTNGS